MKVKRLKDGEIRVIRVKEEAVREFLFEMLIEELEAYFDLLDGTTVFYKFGVDFDTRDMTFAVRDKKFLRPKSDFTKFEEIKDFVGETTKTLFAPNRYIRLKKDENGLHIIQD